MADIIAEWKNTPGTVGVRIKMTKEVERDPNHAHCYAVDDM